MIEELLNVPDGAKLLRFGERSLYRLAREGRFAKGVLAWLEAGGEAQERSA